MIVQICYHQVQLVYMLSTHTKKALAVNIFASLFIFLFVYTAISKLINIDSFKTVLSGSTILKSVAGLLSFVIPISEIAISIMLFLPASREIGFLLTTALMGLFTLYIIYMLLFIHDLPCSCGGIIQQMSWTQHLIFNIVFFSLGFLGWKMTKGLNQNIIAITRTSRTPV